MLVIGLAVFVGVLIWRLPTQLNQDGWLGLVAGREIASHGLPHVDTFTVWAHGNAWVDQQWLAHLALYGLTRVGGLASVAVLHAVLTGGAYVLAVVAARRLGGSAASVLYVVPVALWELVGSTWQIRTQSFAYPLFVGVLWLLAADSRAPSRRVFLVLPLLALWANLHGSVVLGVALVVLRGTTSRRRAALAALAPLTLLATPYGFEIVGYYARTIFNPAFSAMVNEWQPPTLGPAHLPLFALAAATLWLLGQCRRAATPFEQLALVLTCVAGFSATRNIGWFAFAALMLVPRVVDELRRDPLVSRQVAPALHALAAAAAAAFVVGFLAWTSGRPDSFFAGAYPARGGALVAAAADGPVLADVKYADWLLWEHPELRGRLAFDARFELLSARQILRIYSFNNPDGDPWRATARGSSLFVLDGTVSSTPIAALRRKLAARVVFARAKMVVLRTPAPA
jgi:hypothetical protein